jgi:putative spermidine/putrescine transport system substrate-binding protein
MRRVGGVWSAVLLAWTVALVGPAWAQQTLTVAVYGGEWGEAISRAILKPFEQKTGVRIVVEPGVSTVTLSKLKQQKGNPVIDVAWIDGGVSELAADDGLVETLNPKTMANVAGMVPEAVYKTKGGEVFSLGTGFYALGLVYNKDKVKIPPASYMDLWKPEFAGKMTMPSPANAMGVPLFVHLAQVTGGSIANMKPAVDLLKKAKPATFFDTSGIATNLFQSGEVIVGAHYASAAWYMADKGLPIGYAVPKEGAVSGDIRVHVVKGIKNKDLAVKLADFAVSAEAQKALAEILYVAPVNKGVDLSPKARERMPYGAAGSMKDLRIPDWQAINAKRAELTELWNKEVAKR